MTVARPLLLAAVAGTAMLLSGLPARAAAVPTGHLVPSASQDHALALLSDAARAARERTWSGTQYLATWRAGASSSEVVQLEHDPSTGTRVVSDTVAAPLRTAGSVAPSAELDEALLARLAGSYRLTVSGTATCAGRVAQVVEAVRPGGTVAARYWLDTASGLALRRELWDAQGNRLRSTAFVDLQVAPLPQVEPAVLVRSAAAAPAAEAVDGLPSSLPGGYALLAVSHPVHAGATLLHLSYSDGLSAVSVFSQPGSLGDRPARGYGGLSIGGAPVWDRPGSPEQVVWGAHGRVYTAVSDIGHDQLLAVVAALPHQRRGGEGVTERFGRGLARVASWVDPSS